MKKVVLIKDGKVISIVFEIDADAVILTEDEINVGDNYPVNQE